MNIEHSLASSLLSIQAIKLNPANPFTWASGLRSPIYCDNRIALSHPQVRDLIKEGFKQKIVERNYQPDSIIGVATAGIAHGALLADLLSIPFAYVRSKSKEHGRQNIVEGEIAAESSVIVVEDLISTGGSALKAVSVLQDMNVKVLNVFSIFTYNLGEATENFSRANSTYISLTNYPALLDTALKSGYIDDSNYSLLKEWYKSPQVWSEQFVQSQSK